MDQYWVTGFFGLGGVAVGGFVQAVLFWQKSRVDAKERIREHVVRFSADVFLYMTLIRNILEAERANRIKGIVDPVPEATRTDLSERYRAVISSTHALIGSADVLLAEGAESFLEAFANYADGHPGITTGRGGPYPSHEQTEAIVKSASDIQGHRPLVLRPFALRGLRRGRQNGVG